LEDGVNSFTINNQFYISGLATKKGSFNMACFRDDTKGNELRVQEKNNTPNGIIAMGAAVAAIFIVYKDTR
jgi:hypothetical protein